jgi:hypothetical protein
MEMHDRENVDAVWFDAVQDPIRESVRQASSDLSLQNCPGLSVFKNALYGGVDLKGKLVSEALPALFVNS